MIMTTQAGFATTDLEYNAGEGDHLSNNSVRSFTWLKIDVEIEHFASDLEPRKIIANIDGYTRAGKCLTITACVWPLTNSRRVGGHHGTIWFWKNDSAQCTSQS